MKNRINPRARNFRAEQMLTQKNATQPCAGILELHAKGFGFLRKIEFGLNRRDDDVFVPESMIAKLRLAQGAEIKGTSIEGKGKRSPRLRNVDLINGSIPDPNEKYTKFEDRTPTNPKHWLRLEVPQGPIAMRIMDLLCPLGVGQRALLASPPRGGKTTLLKQIGKSITSNHPDLRLVALLIDERPEEVTEFREEVQGEVYASSLDQNAASHARLSKLVIERCRRMAESGENVFLLVDSLTRMSRAFNKLPGLTGAIGAGGLNIHALDIPKHVFSSARSFAEGGSLTIVASVLVETQNRMDEVIFREFKGTGNLDLVLDQKISDLRLWPAIDIVQTATRRVELLHDEFTYRAVTALRKTLLTMQPDAAIRELVQKLKRFETNDEFVRLINGKISV